MRATRWTDDHDRLLADAAPPDHPAGDAEIDRVWNRVVPGMTATPVRRRRLRKRWIGAAVAIGVLVAGTSGIAAGDLFSAHTGKGPSDAEDLRLGGPGEKLDPAAPDFGAVITQATTDIPFPTAAARAVALRHQISDNTRDHPKPRRTAVSTGAIRAWVADAAICSWSNQWAVATRDGDDAARAEAIARIRQAPRWPAVAAIDPHPYARWETQKVRDQQGTVRTERYRDESQFYYLASLGKAVGGVDLGVVADVLAHNNGQCSADLVPDFTQADPMYPAG